MNTSAVAASRRTSSAPCGWRMSMASERLPAFRAVKPAGVSPSPGHARRAHHVAALRRFDLDYLGAQLGQVERGPAARR